MTSQDSREETHEYYHVVDRLIAAIKPESIIDVGCGDCKRIAKYDCKNKTALDLWAKPRIEGVECLQGDICNQPVSRKYDVVLCLQVLEHIEQIEKAIEALFAIASKYVVISLPFQWPAGKQPGHVHDPITDAKLREWFASRRWSEKIFCDNPKRVVLVFKVQR